MHPSQCGVHTGLILVVVAALQHGLKWSASAFELLHYAQGHLTTAQKNLLEQLHGVKHISSLLRPIESIAIEDEACKSLGKMFILAARHTVKRFRLTNMLTNDMSPALRAQQHFLQMQCQHALDQHHHHGQTMNTMTRMNSICWSCGGPPRF